MTPTDEDGVELSLLRPDPASSHPPAPATEGGLVSRHVLSILFRCSKVSLALPLLGLLLLLASFDSYLHHQTDDKTCQMTYMRPYFRSFPQFNATYHRFAQKYALHLYREEGVDNIHAVNGIPVLFIHGNAGSYKQVRSVGAESAIHYRQYLASDPVAQARGVLGMDFFTVDLNEEFSALHGKSLLEQAEFINEAIRYILTLYPTREGTLHPPPSAVILVAHSMGGVVARTAFTLPNHPQGAVNSIVTLSSPHALPPAPFDPNMVATYARVNTYWSSRFEGPNPDPRFADVSLISLAGGSQDTMINSDYTEVSGILPPWHGFTLFTSSLPGVWTSMDHHCILWCEGVVRATRHLLYSIVDARRPSQTLERSERVRIMREAMEVGAASGEAPILLHPSISSPGPGTIEVPAASVVDASTDRHISLEDLATYTADPSAETGRARPYLRVPAFTDEDGEPKERDFLVWTSLPVGEAEGVRILLCNTTENSFSSIWSSTSSGPYTCSPPPISALLTLPGHRGSETREASRFIRLPSALVRAHTAILLHLPPSLTPPPHHFLRARYEGEDARGMYSVGPMALYWYGLVVPRAPSAGFYRSIHIPAILNPALSNIIFVHVPSTCTAGGIRLRQSAPSTTSEVKFPPLLPVEGARSSFRTPLYAAYVSLHGPPREVYLPRDDGRKDGLYLDMFLPPDCLEVELSIRVDLYGSLGRLIKRFDTAVVSYAYGIALLLLALLLKFYFREGQFPSFRESFERMTTRVLPILVLALLAHAIVRPVLMWDEAVARPFPPEGVTVGLWDDEKEVRVEGRSVYGSLVYLLPLMLVMVGSGFVFACCFLLTLLTLLMALPLQGARRLSTRFRLRFLRLSDGPGRWWKRGVFAGVVILLSATILPAQFALFIVFLVQLWNCVRTLLKFSAHSNVAPRGGSLNLGSRLYFDSALLLFIFMHAPMVVELVAWVRNLSVGWVDASSYDHSVWLIAPFTLLVEILPVRHIPPQGQRVATATYMTFVGLSFYTMMYTVRGVYMTRWVGAAVASILLLLILKGPSGPEARVVEPSHRRVSPARP